MLWRIRVLLNYLLISLTLTPFYYTNSFSQPIVFQNPSFEGPIGSGKTPPGWGNCITPSNTPDTHPFSGVTLTPSDGNTYVGLADVSNPVVTTEGVSQILCQPLLTGTNYTFTIDLANANSFIPATGGSARLEIWGGFSDCDKGQLLWQSSVVSNSTTWQTYVVNLTPTANYTHILFVNSLSGFGGSYLLIDNIQVSGIPVLELGRDTALCSGVPVILDAGPGWTAYSWNDGSTQQTINVNATDKYFVSVLYGICGFSDTVDVAFSNLLGNLGDISSCDAPVVLDVGTNGTVYSWSTSETTSSINVSTSGTYSVTVSDGSSCSVTKSVQVAIHPTPIVNLGADVSICGSSYLLDAGNPGDFYSWSNAATTQAITVTTSGTYSVSVTNSFSCSASASVQVTLNTLPVINLGNNLTSCGQSFMLDAGNPTANYLWNTTETAQTIIAATSGVYSVTVTDGNNCSSSATVQVTVHPVPSINLPATLSSCNSSYILDVGNSGAVFLWNNGSTEQSITALASGIYSVTVTNSVNCSATASTQVNLNSSPIVNLGTNLSSCNQPVTLDAGNSGASYLWNTAATTQIITATVSDTYSVTITDVQGCTASASVEVNIHPIPVVALKDTSSCNGAIVLHAGSADNYYLWNTGDTGDNITATVTNTYSVVVTNVFNCTASASANVNIVNLLADAGKDTLIDYGSSVQLTGSGNGSIYSWLPATSLECSACSSPVASPKTTTTYTLLVSDGISCTVSDVVTIAVKPDPNCGDVFIPSAFSPNGDGNNTVLLVRGKCILSLVFIIYNRWGEKVFESTNPLYGWDGNSRGQPENAGVFTFYAKITVRNGDVIEKNGTITLIR